MYIRKCKKKKISLEVTSCLFAGEQFLRVPLSEKWKQILFIDVVTKQNKQFTFVIVKTFQMQM